MQAAGWADATASAVGHLHIRLGKAHYIADKDEFGRTSEGEAAVSTAVGDYESTHAQLMNHLH